MRKTVLLLTALVLAGAVAVVWVQQQNASSAGKPEAGGGVVPAGHPPSPTEQNQLERPPKLRANFTEAEMAEMAEASNAYVRLTKEIENANQKIYEARREALNSDEGKKIVERLQAARAEWGKAYDADAERVAARNKLVESQRAEGRLANRQRMLVEHIHAHGIAAEGVEPRPVAGCEFCKSDFEGTVKKDPALAKKYSKMQQEMELQAEELHQASVAASREHSEVFARIRSGQGVAGQAWKKMEEEESRLQSFYTADTHVSGCVEDFNRVTAEREKQASRLARLRYVSGGSGAETDGGK